MEDELDITVSSTKDTQEKLELADKDVVDAELQAGALKRRLALLEEETARVKVLLSYLPVTKVAIDLRNDCKRISRNAK